MNKENIQKAINVMTRAKERDSVFMGYFQCTPEKKLKGSKIVHTETEFHACGNKACLSGHIAISPEWKEYGGGMNESGAAITDEFEDSDEAIGNWFGVSTGVTTSFIYGYEIYSVPFKEITAQHVIDKLQELMDLGEEAFVSKYDILI